jgi:regulator of replication initiation timing
MENTEFFDVGIEDVKSRIKSKTEERTIIDKELNKLKAELKRKETAKSIYFGEKKKIKPKKAEVEVNEIN